MGHIPVEVAFGSKVLRLVAAVELVALGFDSMIVAAVVGLESTVTHCMVIV